MNLCLHTKVVACIISALLLPVKCLAEADPKDTVMAMLNQVRETGSTLPMLDYVHWPTAFSRMAPAKRQHLRAANPDELQDRYREMMTDPGGYAERQMQEKLKELPPQQQEMMKGVMLSMVRKTSDLTAEIKPRLQGTTYEMGKVSVDGNNATVEIVGKYEDQEHKRIVELMKIDDRWMLPSIEAAGMQGREANAQESAQKSPDLK